MPSRRFAAVKAEYAAWMLDEKGWSRGTRIARLWTVEACQRFLRERERTVLTATTPDLVSWLAEARHPRTRNRRLVDLRAFYIFVAEHRRGPDPTVGIARHPEPRTLPRPLSDPQARKLLSAAEGVGGRLPVVVALFLYSGLRREEAANLSWGDVDLEARSMRVLGKGAKERVIPIPSKLLPFLRAWRIRQVHSSWVFPSAKRPGAHVCKETLGLDVLEAGRAARLRGVSPHRLRHTYATSLVSARVDIRVVQALLGHASLSSTQIYTKVSPGLMRADVERLDFGAAPPAPEALEGPAA